jgi:hypothetical protein
MRSRPPLPLVLGLALLFGAPCERLAGANPRTMALLPSEQTTDAVTATPPASSPAAQSQSPALSPSPTPPVARPVRKPLYRRWWLWTIVGAVVAQSAVIGAIGATPSSPFVPTIPRANADPQGLVRF